MSDQNSNQNPETEAPETCALDHAPITMQRFGRGYRCSAVVNGNLMQQYYPSCTFSAAFTAFEALITCAQERAPIKVERLTFGYRLSAVVDGELMSLTFPDCKLSDALTDFEELLSAVR